MWISKDERKLLRYYYKKTGGRYKFCLDLTKDILIESMKELNLCLKDIKHIDLELEIMESSTYEKIKDIHGSLKERGLLDIEYSGTNGVQDSLGTPISTMKYISLTIDGCDLGRKYSCWFTWIGLWGEEYKGHLIWIVLTPAIWWLISITKGIIQSLF